MKLSIGMLVVFAVFIDVIWLGQQPLWKVFASMAALG